MEILKTCIVCENDFKVKKNQFERRKTCSMKCRGVLFTKNHSGENHPFFKNGLAIKQKYICKSCDKSFISDKGYAGRTPLYCSRKCYGNSLVKERTTQTCIRCGVSFVTKYSNKIHPFCSNKCSSLDKGDKMRFVKKPELSGENSIWWKGGITPINEAMRKGTEYKQWRLSVFKRDNYTCQICSIRGGKLQADHIKPFSLFKELRFDINNGRVLCVDCHKKTDTYGGKMIKYGIQEAIRNKTIG